MCAFSRGDHCGIADEIHHLHCSGSRTGKLWQIIWKIANAGTVDVKSVSPCTKMMCAGCWSTSGYLHIGVNDDPRSSETGRVWKTHTSEYQNYIATALHWFHRILLVKSDLSSLWVSKCSLLNMQVQCFKWEALICGRGTDIQSVFIFTGKQPVGSDTLWQSHWSPHRGWDQEPESLACWSHKFMV